MIPVERGAERRANAGSERDVLDGNGKPGERPGLLAAHERGLGGACLLLCPIGHQCHDGVEPGVEALDYREVGIEHLDRAHRARPHQRAEFARRFSR